MVHGYGGGVFRLLAGMARESGSVRIVGDGHNHWPTVHVDDLAAAYVAAAERARGGNSRVADQIFNVVAEEAVAVTAIGEAIRASVGADRLERWPLGVARQSLGPFADALALDQAMRGHRARQVLAWTPRASTAIADLSAQKQFWRADGE
jgi:nucleoside-diphosphate-sugar epimerase